MEIDALQKAETVVKELVDFRDCFVTKQGIENAHKKNKEVETKLKESLLELDSLQLSIDNKAAFFYLRGRALNVSISFNPRAVECLSKAVKLDPSLLEAWNELGESYWKDKNTEAASNCFNSAIAKRRNKISLRNLSMVLRQLGEDFDSKVSSIRQSVDTAKEAVAMDVTDGHSWFVLGNAYLSLFFFAGQSPAVLKHCMAAYSRAEKDKIECNNPDLHYNRAVAENVSEQPDFFHCVTCAVVAMMSFEVEHVARRKAYKYQENFNEAIEDYKMAALLDPVWNEPTEDKNDLINRLKVSADMIANKGHLKPKKLSNLKNQIKDSDFGPFASGTYTSPLNKIISLSRGYIKDLKMARNDNIVIAGKVVAVAPVKDTVPFPFVLMDKTGECIAVSVFNLAVGKGMIVGDSVAIPEPYLQPCDVTVDNETISFKSIRVDNPVVMVVNKRKVGSERLAFSVLAVTNKSE